MNRKGELVFAFSVALMLAVVAGSCFAFAKPDEPTEGDLYDYEREDDWNWGVDASVSGHWIWLWMLRPPWIGFDEETWTGNRWGGLGVWYVGWLYFTWGYDGNYYQNTTTESSIIISRSVRCHHVYCKSGSWFTNIWTQQWYAETLYAQIDM